MKKSKRVLSKLLPRPLRPKPADAVRITGVIPDPVQDAYKDFRVALNRSGLPRGPQGLDFLHTAHDGLMYEAFTTANHLVDLVRASTTLIRELRRYHNDGYCPATKTDQDYATHAPMVEDVAAHEHVDVPRFITYWCKKCDNAPRYLKPVGMRSLCCFVCGSPTEPRPQKAREIT